MHVQSSSMLKAIVFRECAYIEENDLSNLGRWSVDEGGWRWLQATLDVGEWEGFVRSEAWVLSGDQGDPNWCDVRLIRDRGQIGPLLCLDPGTGRCAHDGGRSCPVSPRRTRQVRPFLRLPMFLAFLKIVCSCILYRKEEVVVWCSCLLAFLISNGLNLGGAFLFFPTIKSMWNQHLCYSITATVGF